MRSLGIDIGGTSVKVALLEGDRITTRRSTEYSRPTSDTLERVLADVLSSGVDRVDSVGLCVPGRLDPMRTHVVQSINLPAIERVSLAELVSKAIGRSLQPLISSDAQAAAHDFWRSHSVQGRLLAISMGTGVGASVLDDGHPLLVSGESPGHLGQVDVTLDGDAGSLTLESYVGVQPLRADFGTDFASAIAMFDNHAKPLRALARGIRIAHAIYRPDTVALLGYVGMLFESRRETIEALVRDRLTSVAKPDWKLMFGTSPFHAAIGAARLAQISPGTPATGV
jgi:predicted NBD/HSP70 family sugar kinase